MKININSEDIKKNGLVEVDLPEYRERWVLKPFGGDELSLAITHKPNMVRRLFYWLFFGWKFEKTNGM